MLLLLLCEDLLLHGGFSLCGGFWLLCGNCRVGVEVVVCFFNFFVRGILFFLLLFCMKVVVHCSSLFSYFLISLFLIQNFSN